MDYFIFDAIMYDYFNIFIIVICYLLLLFQVGDSSGSAEEAPFNIQNMTDVALNTHVLLEDLLLNHGQSYYVYVVGECRTYFRFIV